MNENIEGVRFSILDLALISQGDTTAETLKKSLKLAQNAEAFGYARYWLAEHHNSVSNLRCCHNNIHPKFSH